MTMERNSDVSMILPNIINLNENDFYDEDNEDIVHEQTNQNEIVELIMAAFEGHEELSDGDDEEDEDDDESCDTSQSSHRMLDEQNAVAVHNKESNYHTDEYCVQQNAELPNVNRSNSQLSFRSPINAVSSVDVHEYKPKVNNNVHSQIDNYVNEIIPNRKNHISSNENVNRSSFSEPVRDQSLSQTSSINLNDVHHEVNKLLLLCKTKDRKISQLENICGEYRDKFETDNKLLQHKLELSERSKRDFEQKYQLMNRQVEELCEVNSQLRRTLKDVESRTQQWEITKNQLEKKLLDAESLVETLRKKVNELEHFKLVASSQQDYELQLSIARDKYEQEIRSLNARLKTAQLNLQEKNTKMDEFRTQLEATCKTNEKVMLERIQTINYLNAQLHECQEKYDSLLNTSSSEAFNQLEIQRQLQSMTEEKEKLECKYQELQSELRTLHQSSSESASSNDNPLSIIQQISSDNVEDNEQVALVKSLINQNVQLKQRIDELVINEKSLTQLNEDLRKQNQILEENPKRTYSSSSSSTSSNETVVTAQSHMEKIQSLSNEIEVLKKQYNDLQEKYEYEKTELQTMNEQLREDLKEAAKKKPPPSNLSQNRNAIEEELRTEFEFELKKRLDEMRHILEEEHNKTILLNQKNQEKLEREYDNLKLKHNQQLEQQAKEFYEEMEAVKVAHQRQIFEITAELDKLKTNGDVGRRLEYTEQEFEHLKTDYHDLNTKYKQSLKERETIESQYQNLLKSFERIDQERTQLKKNLENEKEKFLKDIKNVNELSQHQKSELLAIQNQTNQNKSTLEKDIASLQLRIDNYESAISQYEEFRSKLETNLQKLTQQRDRYKTDLNLTQEMLKAKEEECNRLRLLVDQRSQHSKNEKEQLIPYETTIRDLQQQVKEYELKIQDLKYSSNNQTVRQEIKAEYQTKVATLENEKSQLEQRLQETQQTLKLADCHLQQEIAKIKYGLEQEYNRRFENEQKQHLHELNQLRKALTTETDHKQASLSPRLMKSSSHGNIEEIKKMYRAEIDRVHHENVELSQRQAKLIEAHQNQMQIMKKELDDGYLNVINEFQHEQTRLQARCTSLRQQLSDSQRTIEKLRSNLNLLKKYHFSDLSKAKSDSSIESSSISQTNHNKTEHDRMRNQISTLTKTLEQASFVLDEERASHRKQANEYQHIIASLEEKINTLTKLPAAGGGSTKHEFKQERLKTQKDVLLQPVQTGDTVEISSSIADAKFNNMPTDNKIKASLTQIMDNLDLSMKRQILNELIRSRNSMIKEIRREIFDKITRALRSQNIPDATIDMHVFELDRLLSQMAQECSDSSSTSNTCLANSSVLSLQIDPQHQRSRSTVYDSSLSKRSTSVPRKSIECLYMTPTLNKSTALLNTHCQLIIDNDYRSGSASNILVSSAQSSTPSIILSSPPSKFQQLDQTNFTNKIFRSEADLVLDVKFSEPKKSNLNNHETIFTIPVKDEGYKKPSVRALAKEFERKTSLITNNLNAKAQPSDIHYTTTRTIIKEKDSQTFTELTTSPTSTQSQCIKMIGSNSLKLLITPPQQ